MNIRIALAGNPNCGKTTLFNALTGSNQFVGNWPGVTVEKKEGKLKGNKDVIIMDLPGIYSLSPYSPEEVVSRNFLLQENPDLIIVTDEVGYGIVPMDAKDREWREACGRVCTKLAAHAAQVVRVCCGIGTQLK